MGRRKGRPGQGGTCRPGERMKGEAAEKGCFARIGAWCQPQHNPTRWRLFPGQLEEQAPTPSQFCQEGILRVDKMLRWHP